MTSKADLKSMSDEELEQHGFELGRQRAEADGAFRKQMLEQQAEVTRRSDARGGAAPTQEEEPDGE